MSNTLESQAAFEATLSGLLRRQFTHPQPLPAGIQLTDQVAIVTGSNVGLGLEASRQLLQLGLSHLVMGVRSQVKGETAAAQLRTTFPSATISVWILDLESYGSVTTFTEQCKSLPRIDIVILNAALTHAPFTVAPATKHEITMQVNYLSTALLTILLLPILRVKRAIGTARPQVLTLVVSDSAFGADMEANGTVLQQMDRSEAFSQLPWYNKSKLLVVLFVSKLADCVSSDEILINMANPGMTKGTAFFRDVPAVLLPFVTFVQFLLARTLEVGASNYLYAALAQGKESHGVVTSEWTVKPYPKMLYTPEGKAIREKLWKETLEEFNAFDASSIVESFQSSAK